MVKEIISEYNIYIWNKALCYALYKMIQLLDILKTS
jgi:hypothetical protein